MKNLESKIKWCIEQHSSTNHTYDGYLPYEYHLRMVAGVYERFQHLLPKNLIMVEVPTYRDYTELVDRTHEVIYIACFGHDLIEDTRVSYNDVKTQLGYEAAEIIYALTNEKGKNRKERANDKYYKGIRDTNGAVFVKLCDRIANVEYSLSRKSSMFEKYQKENPEFILALGYQEVHGLKPMFNYLIEILSDQKTKKY